MNLIIISLLIILGRVILLILRSSLPIQALALLLISGARATVIAVGFSILLGIYTILIYARGLLVLLAYFVALSPNQNLNSPSRTTVVSLIITSIFIISQTRSNSSLLHLSLVRNYTNNVITILSPYSSSLLIIIALILVLTIIAVVKVSRISSGPVRP
jgi:hypothetical protein